MGILDGHAHLASGVFVGEGGGEAAGTRPVLAVGRFGDDGLYLRCLTDDAGAARRAVFGMAACAARRARRAAARVRALCGLT
ncbi:MAG: hypothetical protein U5J97_01915 [Trueperaceae bacterium]|nr:hypothetical protein [Trueperaceae bacterium]